MYSMHIQFHSSELLNHNVHTFIQDYRVNDKGEIREFVSPTELL